MGQVNWLEMDEQDEQTPRKGKPWLLIGALVPWVVVIALLVVPDLGEEAPDEPTQDVETSPRTGGNDAPDNPAAADNAATDAPEDRGEPEGDDRIQIAELRGDWRVEAGIEEAATLAVVVARQWLTGVEPAIAQADLPAAEDDGYAEHLVVEAIEYPADDAAVITIVGTVLQAGANEAHVIRIAVPITFTDEGPRAGGTPWELPAPSLETATPERTANDDPDDLMAAAQALQEAGLGDLTALYDTDGWPVIAEVAGNDENPESTTVWLRPHLDGFVVAGTTLTEPTLSPQADAATNSQEHNS